MPIYKLINLLQNHELVFSEEMCKPAVAAAQRLKPDTPANEVIFACRTVHETTDLIATYTPSRKYTGNIHLIAADSSVYAYELDKYYGLKKVRRNIHFCIQDSANEQAKYVRMYVKLYFYMQLKISFEEQF